MEMAWQAQAPAGPLQAACRAVGEQRVRAAVLGALAPYTGRTGVVRVPNSFRYITAVPAQDRRLRGRWRLLDE